MLSINNCLIYLATSLSDGPKEGEECGGNEMHAPASTCDAYLLCVSGNWRKQLCPSGLHWDKRTNRCDWTEFAMCESKLYWPDNHKKNTHVTRIILDIINLIWQENRMQVSLLYQRQLPENRRILQRRNQ